MFEGNIFSEEIKVFTPDVHTDYRGELWTTWKKDEFPMNLEFNHDKVLHLGKMLLEVYTEIISLGS